MKITDVKVETIRIPMKKPFRIAFAVQDHSLNVLVKISTDEGLWGIGEAAPFEPVTGESAATVLEALKLFRTGLIGMDPLDVEGIHRMMDRLLSGNTSAKAAVDIALYDIKGKLMGQPLYKVLGGSVNQIVTDMTVGIDTPEAMAAEARAERERDARVVLAEVEKDISSMLVDAAHVYEENEVALRLRTMHLLYESVRETGGTVVVPSSFSEGFGDVLGDAAKDALGGKAEA